MTALNRLVYQAAPALDQPQVPEHIAERALDALGSPHSSMWTVQGLGMLRTYLDDDRIYRLHVWDYTYRTVGPLTTSDVHTHPWDMCSLVVLGSVTNILWSETDRKPSRQDYDVMEFKRQLIECGPGGGRIGDPSTRYLEQLLTHKQVAGTEYSQKAHAIHTSVPASGSVTLVNRFLTSDVDHAYVYWRANQEWQSAEPRVATAKEVEDVFRCLHLKWSGDD